MNEKNSQNNRNDSAVDVDAHLDAKGLQCPLPLLKAKQALNQLNAGQVLAVEATDAGSVRDFKAYCDIAKHDLLESYEKASVYYYLIRKA